MASQLKACFVAGTPIRTPSGSKPIEELEVGDEVLSRSEHQASGEVRTRRVLQKFVRVSPILELNIAGRLIGTTAEHPFYAYDRGWVNAKELIEGDRVLTENGQWLRVDGLKDSGCVETVHNVEVEEDHAYFVGEEDWGWAVWAHNADYGKLKSLENADPNLTSIGANLAERAKTLLVKSGLNIFEKSDTTIAIGRILENAFEKLKQFAPNLIKADGKMHAETYLYLISGGRTKVQAIGVSHFTGPCPNFCKVFFTTTGYNNIWWHGFVK